MVAPHQFASPGYAALHSHLQLWGAAFLLAGVALLAVALLDLPPPFELAAHLLGGATLIILAYGVAAVSAWTGTINLGTLGVGIAVAPFLAGVKRRPSTQGRDLLAIVLGTGALLTGLVVLLLPGQFGSPFFDPVRSFLPLLGSAFLLSGLCLVAISFWAGAPRAAVWAAHLLAGATLLVFFAAGSLPLRAWIGMVYYGGFGVTIASLPWWRSRLEGIDPASLRLRLALVLSIVAVAPLLFTTSFTLDRQEEATARLALSGQQSLAAAVARDVADYVGLHRAAVVGLAALPGLLDESPDAQHASLKAFASAYPEVLAIVTRDDAGNGIAQSGDLLLSSVAGEPAFERLRQANRTQVIAQFLPTLHQAGLSIATPVLGQGGRAKGYVASAIALRTVAEAVASAASSAGAKAYLVDDRGHVIAHPDPALIASFADLSQQPPVAALLADQQRSGSLRYGPAASEELAGYAPVPELGWGVVVEHPAAMVLAETRAQRDTAFIALMLAALVAAGLGLALANSIVRPLRRLVTAVGEIAWRDRQVALPEPRVSELRLLSKAIGEVDDRLAVTEAERERLLEQVQAQYEELRVTNEGLTRATKEAQAALQARDEFLSVAAHELKTPVTSLRGYAQTLVRQLEKAGEVDPTRLNAAMAQIDRQSVRLANLVNQLLDLSRIEAGKLVLDKQPADVSAVVEAAVATLRHVQPQRDFLWRRRHHSLPWSIHCGSSR